MTYAPPFGDPLATLLRKLEAWTREGGLAQAQDLEAWLTARAGDDPSLLARPGRGPAAPGPA